MERKTLQSSDNIEFEFSWGWLASGLTTSLIFLWTENIERIIDDFGHWTKKEKFSYENLSPMTKFSSFRPAREMWWVWENDMRTRPAPQRSRKSCAKEFQVELPHHRHFLMTREVRCNLWLSGPDIRRSLFSLSVVPDYCQLDFIHLLIHLSASHSKKLISATFIVPWIQHQRAVECLWECGELPE